VYPRLLAFAAAGYVQPFDAVLIDKLLEQQSGIARFYTM